MRRGISGIARPAVIFVIALALRLWNSLSTGQNFYANYLSDASTYRQWASSILEGIPYGDPIFIMGPLYPYFLALNLWLGLDYDSILILQALLGALTCLGIYLVAGRIYGRGAAFITGIIAALYAPFIFYSGLLLSESLQVMMLILSLILLTSTGSNFRQLKILVAGVIIGLAALAQGTIILFAILAASYWLIENFMASRQSSPANWKKAGLILAGAAIGIMPAAVHNLAGGDFVPIASNLGINFYIGNNMRSSGTYDAPPGLNLADDFSGRKVAERETGQRLKASGVSSFWMTKSIEYIKGQPLHFIRGLANKGWLYLWSFDIPQAESIQLQHMYSIPFRLPLPGFGFVLILGLTGIILSRRSESWRLLLLLLTANLLGVTLFFAIGRFRLIGAIPLLIFSGLALTEIIGFIKNRQKHELLTAFVMLSAFAIIAFLPRSIDPRNKLASAHNNLGLYYYFTGDIDRAASWYHRAEKIMPTFSGALNNIGTYFYLKNQIDSAEYYFNKSWACDSTENETAMNLGRLAEDKKDFALAEKFYTRARELAPFGLEPQTALERLKQARQGKQKTSTSADSFDELSAIAESYAARGEHVLAQGFYERALLLRPEDIKTLNNLGFSYQATKKFSRAADCFTKLIGLEPANAVAINNLAGTVYQMGQADSAISLWERALKLEPDNAQIKKNLEYVRRTRPK